MSPSWQRRNAKAQGIAAGWAEGGDPLQQLASTGYIAPPVLDLITQLMIREIRELGFHGLHRDVAERIEELAWLNHFCIKTMIKEGGIREQVDGWSSLW